ncbi:hypothetical protein BH11MYX3_BH11MYX3_04520 [soil metagenome]
MKLFAAAAVLCTVSVAAAETSFTEDSQRSPQVPTSQLFEAACDVDVELRGVLALVEVRQRIVNPGPLEMAATYQFDLPPGATITGFSLRGDGATETAVAIPGRFNTVDAAARPVLDADPALLTALAADEDAQYRVRLQPIAANHEVWVTTRYSMIGEIRGSALRVVLLGRANSGKLTACRGVVRASAGPGATVQGFRIGALVTSRSSASFVLDARDVEINANLAFTARDPVVWTQTQPITESWNATLVTVAAPPVKTTTAVPRRALFVIDGSRSMELVGKQNVTKVIAQVASALPANVEIEGIIYDRVAERVFKSWKPESSTTIADLQTAVTKHVAHNGSSITRAFELAHTVIADGVRSQTMVIVISDGVLGNVAGADLTRSLDLMTSTVDVIAVVLDPGRTRSPDAAALRSPVNLYGGSFVELAVDDIDDALQVVDEWLRPSWLELALGKVAVPATVRAGSGFTRVVLHRGPLAKLVLTGHGDTTFRTQSRAAPTAPIATVALASVAGDTDLEISEQTRTKALAINPYARSGLAFAVLTTQGKVARSRLAMVRGGGPYERITSVDDPSTSAASVPGSAISGPPPSAIAKITLERLFRDQLQPKAYACYQRALGTNPRLAGTVLFELRLGRGEITDVFVNGVGDAPFETCLADAAYAITIPFPDFTVNADDQTLAHYPLTFNVNEARPAIVLGDADSTSPLDIDAIQGGVPVKVRYPTSSTPLGDMRPGKQP